MIRRVLHHISRLENWRHADDLHDEGANYDTKLDMEERLTPAEPNRANTVSSRVDEEGTFNEEGSHCRIDDDVMHAPVLDIDFPIFTIPSSTPGHFHLYIEKPITWYDYRRLLEVLADCAIIEPGYARASIERGATYVRVPTSLKPTREQEEAANAGGNF